MADATIFVAREQEMKRLDDALGRVLAGNGQICLIAGDAGTGKTALSQEFCRRSQGAIPDLVAAIGQSDAQTGMGDAYLPFRELLAQLTGDVEAAQSQRNLTDENVTRLKKFVGYSGQALVELGPDLIGVFIPGAGLATRAATFLAEKVGWLDRLEQLTNKPKKADELQISEIDQGHIFEQYTNVLIRLAQKQPLLILLDDLQWADEASINLLFRLGRRISGSRILLLGTYRPAEVAMGRSGARHPLEKVQMEFRRYFGDIVIDLNETGEDEDMCFVAGLLQTEANGLGDDFQQALYQHTHGHPLFTIELLRAMQERGAIQQDQDGRWVETEVLDWETFPARVEGVIEERIGRLEDELQEMLTAASVEGEVFTAEVIAQVQAVQARALIRQMSSALEKQHRLVSAQGNRRLEENQQRLSFYRFQHNLFQRYLYNSLSSVERVCLHEDIGNFLEELYGEQVDDIAVQLARHFSEADLATKARVYLFKAGQQAAGRYANEEALGFFERTLELTPEGEYDRRFEIWMEKEQLLNRLGDRDEQGAALDQAESCNASLGSADPSFAQRKARLALRRTGLADAVGDYAAIEALCQQVIEYARDGAAPEMEAEAYRRSGFALFNQGEVERAKPQYDRALELAQQADLKQVQARTITALGLLCQSQGRFPEGQSYNEQALAAYRAIGDRQGESSALNGLAIIAAQQGKLAEAQENFEKAVAIMVQIGERRGEGMVTSNLGGIAFIMQDYARARTRFLQAMQVHQETDDKRGMSMISVNLGGATLKLGDFGAAQQYLEEGLRISQEIGLRHAEAQALGYLSLLYHYKGDDQQALRYAEQMLEIEQELGDRMALVSARMFCGHAYFGLKRYEDAAESYRQGLSICLELGQEQPAMEALAGLAKASWADAQQGQVREWIEELLVHLEADSVANKEEPLGIHLTVYELLSANDDPRADGVLQKALKHLEAMAAKIEDSDERHSFLEELPIHRALRAARK